MLIYIVLSVVVVDVKTLFLLVGSVEEFGLIFSTETVGSKSAMLSILYIKILLCKTKVKQLKLFRITV